MRLSRPSVLMVITVRHRRLPFGRVSVPLLSVGVYVLAWCLRVGLSVVPAKKLQAKSGGKMPVDPKKLGPVITKVAWTVVCAGSYTLVDVRVESEGVGVTVRLI